MDRDVLPLRRIDHVRFFVGNDTYFAPADALPDLHIEKPIKAPVPGKDPKMKKIRFSIPVPNVSFGYVYVTVLPPSGVFDNRAWDNYDIAVMVN